jgi:hypothetical protein
MLPFILFCYNLYCMDFEPVETRRSYVSCFSSDFCTMSTHTSIRHALVPFCVQAEEELKERMKPCLTCTCIGWKTLYARHFRARSIKHLAVHNTFSVCSPTRNGGLGILNLKFFGTALHCRWPWLKWASDQRPWLLIPIPNDRDALSLFRAASYIKTGDDKTANFWSDKWLPGRQAI